MATEHEGGIRTYRDLIAWQKAMELAERTYELPFRRF
jgi:hypothetical protein